MDKDKEVDDKFETLMKYIPFIDFVLQIDKQKYVKFFDIRKWIITKTRYPIDVLNKIEKSIITQYKNLMLVDDKIPKEIMNIFNGEISHQFVNLCSDDDDDDENKDKEKHKSKKDKHKSKKEKRRRKIEEELKKVEDKLRKATENKSKTTDKDNKSSTNYKNDKRFDNSSTIDKDKKSSSSHKNDTRIDDSEDDLEIVSVDYVNKPKENEKVSKPITTTTDIQLSKKEDSTKNDLNLDDISADLLRKIDTLHEDEKNIQYHEPINYLKSDDDDEIVEQKVFQKRKSDQSLFKRREDFKDQLDNNDKQELAMENKENKNPQHKRNSISKSPTNILETISLDSSDSDSESLSNVATTSKAAAAAAAIKATKLQDAKQLTTCNEKEDLNKKSDNSTIISTNQLDKIVTSTDETKKETLHIPNDKNANTSVSSDRVICATKTTIDISETETTPNNKPSSTLNPTHDDAIIDLLDMDIDTENDLDDVLNEAQYPTTPTNNKTTEELDTSITASTFRNPSPPTKPKDSSPNNSNNQKDMEISSPALSNNSVDLTNVHNLTSEDICRIFEDSQTDDIEIGKLLEIIKNIVGLSNSTNNANENTPPAVSDHQNDMPPPAPHFNSIIASPIQPGLQQQPIFCPNPMPTQQMYLPPHPHPQQYLQNQHMQQTAPMQYNNGAANFMPRSETHPKVSIRDPRIKKHLQFISSSPVLSEVNRKSAELIMGFSQQHHQQQQQNYLPSQQQQQQTFLPSQHQQQQQQQHFITANHQQKSQSSSNPAYRSAPINNRRKSLTQSKITFGEYKQRREEQQEELKRKHEEEIKRREEELKAKRAQELEQIEQREALKKTDEIRSILLSTLEPYKNEIHSLLNKQNHTQATTTSSSSSSSQKSKVSKDDSQTQKQNLNNTSTKKNNEKIEKTKEPSPPKKSTDNCLDGQKSNNDKLNRIYRELQCTVKGFDQLNDYIPKSIGGKRRSSVHARSAISEQLSSQQNPTDNSDQSDVNLSQPSKSLAPKRRSSIYQSLTDESVSQSPKSSIGFSDTTDINSSQSNQGDIPKSIAGKRRSSIHARSVIQEQLKDLQQPTTDYSDSSDFSSSQSLAGMPKLIAVKRTSSIFARQAIEEQLKEPNTTTDYSDSDFINSSQSTIDELCRNSCTAKRRKTIDEVIQPTRRVKTFIIESSDSENNSSDDERDFDKFRLAKIRNEALVKRQRFEENIIKNQPSVQLKRISQDFILKHTRRKPPQYVLNVHLVESTTKSSNNAEDTLEKLPQQTAQNNKKTVKPKKLNNDFKMTEHNTKFCVLCSSKPSDLTNHYIRKHKIESYVSRLTCSQIEILSANTPFAKLQPKTGNSRIQRFEVYCPFCDDNQVEPFMALYDHYSTHTGEFAYQCGHCLLDKPFRADIMSHQCHSKTCRKSNIKVLYRYPPHVQCIYLHFCVICNFVQLNEANILKHLREHHDPRKAVIQNVDKCILAAISDAPDTSDKLIEENVQQQNTEANEETPLKAITKPEIMFQVNDDDIPVSNEACSEDIFEEKFSLEEQLKQMHADPNIMTPMTVIHCGRNSLNISQNNTPTRGPPNALNINRNNTPTRGPSSLNTLTRTPTSSSVSQNNTPSRNSATLNIPPPSSSNINLKNTPTLGASSSNVNQNNTPLRNSATLDIPQAPSNNVTTPQRHLPMVIKDEPMEIDENLLITPPRPGIQQKITQAAAVTATQEIPTNVNPNISKTLQETTASTSSKPGPKSMKSKKTANISKSTKLYSTIYQKYRTYPCNVNYLGLYKCMADDCFYSTDYAEEMLQHLNDHVQDCLPNEYLHCPYCIIKEKTQITPLQLIEHIRSEHQHMIYQCSICCYRSCEASNVAIHQIDSHSGATNVKIFKCAGAEICYDDKELHINMKIMENVRKINCPYCSNASFYNCNILVEHLNKHHKIRDGDGLKAYSCIYCCLTDRDPNKIRHHVSIKHPAELPFLYDHNIPVDTQEDPINKLNILNVSQPIDFIEVNPISDTIEETKLEDVKPELDQLIKMNEDTIKIRLRKLTAHTGVPPDSLYRCPESTCGGFFSLYDLWLRHMRIRHCCLECQCPHCPPNKQSELRSLESFSIHFEEHRRHTFICFYCSVTTTSEDLAKQHAAQEHSNLGEMRFEKISCNVNYSYFIMIQTDVYNDRVEFINEILALLDRRLLDMENIEAQKLKRKWLVQNNTSWLEDVPKFTINRRLIKKCLDETCKFRTLDEDALFNHLKAKHDIYRQTFTCSKCNLKILCTDWNDILDHVKLHSDDSIFICVACSHTNANRTKLSEHIRDEHCGRDVPVIQIIRSGSDTTYVQLAVVFANNHLTFSTMRNCFCCAEKGMNGDALNLHLRRYHHLTLNYFCEWCHTAFKTLEEVQPHFQNVHPKVNLKIRCELATNSELLVISLKEFQIQISNEYEQMPIIEVKQEPNDQPDDDDDDVVLLEDDDVVIQEAIKNQQQLVGEVEKPKLKCIAMNNLLEARNTTTTSSPNLSPVIRVLPNVKIVKIGETKMSDSVRPSSSASFITPPTTPTITLFQNASMVLDSNSPPQISSTTASSNVNQVRPSVDTTNALRGVRPQSNASSYNGSTPNVRPPNTAASIRPTNIVKINKTNTQNPVSAANNARPIPSIVTQNNARPVANNYARAGATNPYNMSSHRVNNNYANPSINNQHYAAAPSYNNQHYAPTINQHYPSINNQNYATPGAPGVGQNIYYAPNGSAQNYIVPGQSLGPTNNNGMLNHQQLPR